MTKIKIPFNNWSIKRLRNSRKTATSRNKKYGTYGDTFIVDGMKFKLISITYITLLDVAYNHFKEEGAKNPQEFIDVWNELHPKTKFVENQKVYFHTFRRILVF